jgi:hypothetical protein
MMMVLIFCARARGCPIAVEPSINTKEKTRENECIDFTIVEFHLVWDTVGNLHKILQLKLTNFARHNYAAAPKQI